MASLMLAKPDSHISLGAFSNGNIDALKASLVKEVGERGIFMLLGAVTTLLGSILLLNGVRTSSKGHILPWIIISIVDTSYEIAFFIMRAPRNHASPFKVMFLVAYFGLSVYLIICVHSYYQMLKRRNLNNIAIISSSSIITINTGKF